MIVQVIKHVFWLFELSIIWKENFDQSRYVAIFHDRTHALE